MTDTTTTRTPGLRPWSMVLGLGFVSLFIDMVSDGAISVGGALLEQLGASAALVGIVTGAATAIALVLRLVTGPWADRTSGYWGFTIVGYAMSAVSVPLLAFTPVLGTASLAAASTLILVERTGKAVRGPAKTVLLADAAGVVGRGKGFGVHKLLDQIGAFAGPLVLAAIAALTGELWPAFLALAIPAVIAMVLLAWLRARVPDTSVYRPVSPATEPTPAAEPTPEPASDATARPRRRTSALSRLSGLSAIPTHVRTTFLLFATFAALTTFGLLSFGVVSFHLVAADLVPVAGVPLVYAAGMAAAAVGALATGWVYDRAGSAILFAVPLLTAFVPGFTLAGTIGLVVLGVVIWGLATGVQDSTVKALVADLVPAEQRGSAYGWFAVFQGVGALAGASIAGALYGNVPVLIVTVVVLQVAAAVLLVVVLRRHRAERMAQPA
ncbi:MFS family permease [Agromyces flavus]|uniref:MFS family permease n=1 Tax=Agromyces flavus TaxID=589382 RepID=A0ABT1KJW4_9MICO|nr:MFS transporter [Agromyces flavus]MCP2367174.1 MFS family permease [Agromyces flavus]GGI46255.1 major facilitator superfamily protein [Agromyces flavus]